MFANVVLSPAAALETLDFQVTGGDEALIQDLKSASVLLNSKRAENTQSQDVLVDARADYANLLNALYAAGHYSGVISILVDGREAAEIPLFDLPENVTRVAVTITPGPVFAFSNATIRPLAARTKLAKAFAIGQPAKSNVVVAGVATAIDAWRAQGHAKAAVAQQNVTADHFRNTLEVDVVLKPGPVLRFGPLVVEGQVRMRPDRIRKIAGLKRNAVFDPREVVLAAERLRRSGIFGSVVVSEDETITPPDVLGMKVVVVEQEPRRMSFGLEAATDTGLAVTGGWLHRNLFGGGERFSVTGALTNIGLAEEGIDWTLGANIKRPATLSPDTSVTFGLDIGQSHDADFQMDLFSVRTALQHVFDEKLSAELGLGYDYAQVQDPTDVYVYQSLSVPFDVAWDNRDVKAEPTSGVYLMGQIKPFLGFGATDDGVRVKFDARGYKSLDPARNFTLAGRIQAGAIYGASLLGTPRDDLFFSGGGGTVRGHPYQSLGVNVRRDGLGVAYLTGGSRFLAASLEARARVSQNFGIVGFFDIGMIDVDDFGAQGDNWHSGAGLGIRYKTAIGPIRFDVAVPVAGGTAQGLQVYVGLGQAF
jgi:translocation and assembly module TamA